MFKAIVIIGLVAAAALTAAPAAASLLASGDYDAFKMQFDIIAPAWDIGTYRTYSWQPDIGSFPGSKNNFNVHVFNSEGEQVVDYTTSNPNGPRYSPDKRMIGVGSNCKVITSATFMASMVDTGLATLDSTLAELLPDLFGPNANPPPANPDSGNAKIGQLLSHTSGCPGGGTFASKLDPTVSTLEEVVAVYAQTTEEGYKWGTPGEFFVYSNAGFQVVALAIQKNTGMMFEEAFQKYIAEPVGMIGSFECQDQGSSMEMPAPASGLCTTADSHAKFFQMLLLNGKTPDGTRVITEESVDDMFTDQTNGADLTNMYTFLTWDKWAGFPCGTYFENADNAEILEKAANPVLNLPPPMGPKPLTIDPELLTQENKPILGYGTGIIITTGVKSKGYLHFDSRGWAWYISRNRFAVTMAPYRRSLDNNVSPTLIPAVYVLERDHYPDTPMCTGFNNLEEDFILNQLIDPTTAMKYKSTIGQLEGSCDACATYGDDREACQDAGCFFDKEFKLCRKDLCKGLKKRKCRKIKSCRFDKNDEVCEAKQRKPYD